jgi:hypothetical protein
MGVNCCEERVGAVLVTLKAKVEVSIKFAEFVAVKVIE